MSDGTRWKVSGNAEGGVGSMIAWFGSRMGVARTVTISIARSAFLMRHATGTPFSALGLRRPSGRLAPALVAAFLFGVLFKVVMKAIVMPVFGAPAANQTSLPRRAEGTVRR